jgi:hypothetical protein
MFDKNVIFDDLEIERHFRAHGMEPLVLDRVAIPLVSHGFRHFCRQRLIYAYETMAFPFMFGFLKSILPAAGLLALLSGALAAGWLGFVCLSCWITAVLGWRKIRNEHLSWRTTLGAFPLVFSYAVMVWAASCWRLGGGVWFAGGRQLFVPGEARRPAPRGKGAPA